MRHLAVMIAPPRFLDFLGRDGACNATPRTLTRYCRIHSRAQSLSCSFTVASPARTRYESSPHHALAYRGPNAQNRADRNIALAPGEVAYAREAVMPPRHVDFV